MLLNADDFEVSGDFGNEPSGDGEDGWGDKGRVFHSQVLT